MLFLFEYFGSRQQLLHGANGIKQWNKAWERLAIYNSCKNIPAKVCFSKEDNTNEHNVPTQLVSYENLYLFT